MTRVRAPMVPPGALPRGSVHVLKERCKGCGLCIAFCPRHVLAESPNFNSIGYHPPAVVRPDACADCQICYLICPEFAIFSTPLNLSPCHRVTVSGLGGSPVD
jgi:2-oxoglutarate ferredoxin oxidoreductase subunit delta